MAGELERRGRRVIGADGVPGRVLRERVDEADHDKLDAEDVDPHYGEEGGQPSAPGRRRRRGTSRNKSGTTPPTVHSPQKVHDQAPPGSTRLRAERSAGTLPHRTVM